MPRPVQPPPPARPRPRPLQRRTPPQAPRRPPPRKPTRPRPKAPAPATQALAQRPGPAQPAVRRKPPSMPATPRPRPKRPTRRKSPPCIRHGPTTPHRALWPTPASASSRTSSSASPPMPAVAAPASGPRTATIPAPSWTARTWRGYATIARIAGASAYVHSATVTARSDDGFTLTWTRETGAGTTADTVRLHFICIRF